eukprot:TRINITY_DN12602_c0_g1_i1.p1 TRINITY_DN12602_c0_g1~~TRINITY_DN12602_c0_g1_i1.p1  ORF type:complete len:369 (+),score=58.46 TRINITY_DN12602_c0_g1_i1:277-1383(+)
MTTVQETREMFDVNNAVSPEETNEMFDVQHAVSPEVVGNAANQTSEDFVEDSSRTPTREDLLERGISASQADAVLVRLHTEEVLRANFRRWICCFGCLVILLTVAMVGILLWMIVAYLRNRRNDCDVPIQAWAEIAGIVVVYNSTINRPSPNGSYVIRMCCRWRRDPHNPQPMPMRVRLYDACVMIFMFAWNCVGLHWVRASGKEDSGVPSCTAEAPELLSAVKVYASFDLAFTVFMYINVAGFAHILRTAMLRGMLHTSNAAPKGALLKHTDLVKPGNPILQEQEKCPICLENFSGDADNAASIGNSTPTRLARQKSDTKMEVVLLKSCSHCFHKTCLQGWLNVNRVCPICRTDVCGDSSAAAAGGS